MTRRFLTALLILLVAAGAIACQARPAAHTAAAAELEEVTLDVPTLL